MCIEEQIWIALIGSAILFISFFIRLEYTVGERGLIQIRFYRCVKYALGLLIGQSAHPLILSLIESSH